MAPARGSTGPDGAAAVLAVLALAASLALFLLLDWRFALVAVLAICLGTLLAFVLAPRRPAQTGRSMAAVILGLALLLIVAQEAALAALASGAFRPPDGLSPAVWGGRAVPRLAQALRHGDTEDRVWAAEALRPYGHAALRYWHAAMRDPEPRVRLRAISAMERYPDPASEPLLRAAMQDPDLMVRSAVGPALYAVADLETLRQAARLLAAYGRQDTYVVVAGIAGRQYALTEQAVADTDANVRLGMVMALERITAPRAVRLLQTACRDADSRVRGFAVRGLGSVCRQLIREYERPMGAGGGYDAAWQGGPEDARLDVDGIFNGLVALLRDSQGRVSDEALGALEGLIRDFPPGGPRGNSMALARPVSATTYARLLDSLLSLVRLRRVGPEIPRIIETGFGSRAYAPVFIRRLRDGSSEIRRQAAWMLGCIGDPSAVPALARADPAVMGSTCSGCDADPCQFCEAIVRITPGTPVRHAVHIEALVSRQTAPAPHQHHYVALRDGTALFVH